MAAVDHYDTLYQSFRWWVPDNCNIAELCCGRWARHPEHTHRVAIVVDDADHEHQAITYAMLQQDANRLSHVLRSLGVQSGTRVAIVMSQRPEVAAAHIACQQLGAIAMPLSVLFGPEAMAYRLQDSETTVAIEIGRASCRERVLPTV